MRVVTRTQVVLFLVEAKKLASTGCCVLVRRRKNLDALASLAWNAESLLELIRDLQPENYVGGPEEDRDRPGEDVWVFGVEIEGCERYVKLKIKRGRPRDLLLCLSFHEAERPLDYPYAGR